MAKCRFCSKISHKIDDNGKCPLCEKEFFCVMASLKEKYFHPKCIPIAK